MKEIMSRYKIFVTIVGGFIVLALLWNRERGMSTSMPLKITPDSAFVISNVVYAYSSCPITNLPAAISSDARIAGGMVDGMIPSDRLEQEKRDADRALVLMNHVNWVVTKIKAYNDPAVLEEEYENISQNAIRLDNIKDVETIQIICKIMDVITEMRIEEKKRDMLREELDQGMSDALFESLSGISPGSAISPLGAVFNLMTSAATAGVNYKRAKNRLLRAYKKDSWALDENRMRYLNELNTDLLTKYWELVQKYNLQDKYRVTENDIKLLIERLKDPDCERRYRFLVANGPIYVAFQNYWYYLGATALECGLRAEAKQAFLKFQQLQEIGGKILRRDGIAAKNALQLAKLLIDEKAPKAEVRRQLSIVLENCATDDWTLPYFCALVRAEYLAEPQDLAEAETILNGQIDALTVKNHNSFVKWQDLMEERSVEGHENINAGKPSSAGDALFECKTLLVRLGQIKMSESDVSNRLERICSDANASAREKLFCYFSLGYRQALDRLMPDLRRIRVYAYSKDEARVMLPLSWIRSREAEMMLHLSPCLGTVDDALINYKDWSTGTLADLKSYFDEESIARIRLSLAAGRCYELCSERTLPDGSEDRMLAQDEEGNSYVVLRFPAKPYEARSAILTFRFDKHGTVSDECYQVALHFEFAGRAPVAPCEAAFGKWIRSKTSAGKCSIGRWERKPAGMGWDREIIPIK